MIDTILPWAVIALVFSASVIETIVYLGFRKKLREMKRRLDFTDERVSKSLHKFW